MNKQELIERMAGKTGLSKKDCGTALDGFLSAVTEALQAGEAVKLTGFGSFEVKHRRERGATRRQKKLWKFQHRPFTCSRRERD